MFKDQSEYRAHVWAKTRAWEQAQANNETASLRAARERLIAAGLRWAIAKAPDNFPDVNVDVLASQVVDLIERI